MRVNTTIIDNSTESNTHQEDLFENKQSKCV